MSKDIFNKLNLHQRIKTLYVDGQFVTDIRLLQVQDQPLFARKLFC